MQRQQPSSFNGQLRLTQVRGVNLAAEDTLTNSSDPYFVLMYRQKFCVIIEKLINFFPRYPDGEKYKSSHFTETTNPKWEKLTLNWTFSNLQ
jgi:hypothetical protein